MKPKILDKLRNFLKSERLIYHFYGVAKLVLSLDN